MRGASDDGGELRIQKKSFCKKLHRLSLRGKCDSHKIGEISKKLSPQFNFLKYFLPVPWILMPLRPKVLYFTVKVNFKAA